MRRAAGALGAVAFLAGLVWFLSGDTQPDRSSNAHGVVPDGAVRRGPGDVEALHPDVVPDMVAARTEAASRIRIRVTLDGEPVDGAAACVTTLTDEMAARISSTDGLSHQEALVRSRPVQMDEQGYIALEAVALPLFVAVGGPPVRPTGVLIDSATDEVIEVECEPGFTARGTVELLGGGLQPGVRVVARRKAFVDDAFADDRLAPARIAAMFYQSETTTDEAGNFELTGLSTRSHVWVDHPPYSPETLVHHASSDAWLRFVLRPTSATVVGRVVDDVDETPIEGAFVHSFVVTGTMREDHIGHAVTGADGRFRLRTRSEEAGLRLRVIHDDYATEVAELVGLTAGREEPVKTVRMRRASRITGRVVDDDGAPVHLAQLVAYREVDGLWCFSAETGADGRFEIRGLNAGRLLLRSRRARRAPAADLDRGRGGRAGRVGHASLARAVRTSGRTGRAFPFLSGSNAPGVRERRTTLRAVGGCR